MSDEERPEDKAEKDEAPAQPGRAVKEETQKDEDGPPEEKRPEDEMGRWLIEEDHVQWD